MNRRNLSGVYIFHKFDDEESRQPTCFEDCPRDKQEAWLNDLEPEAVKRLAIVLGDTLRKIGDTFDIKAGESDN